MPHTPRGVPLFRRRQRPRSARSQHKSSNYLRFCEASLLRTDTSQSKYYRVHVQNKLTSSTRFQFSPTKDSLAGGARGFNLGAISSLPVFFEPGLARACPSRRAKFSRQIVTTLLLTSLGYSVQPPGATPRPSLNACTQQRMLRCATCTNKRSARRVRIDGSNMQSRLTSALAAAPRPAPVASHAIAAVARQPPRSPRRRLHPSPRAPRPAGPR